MLSLVFSYSLEQSKGPSPYAFFELRAAGSGQISSASGTASVLMGLPSQKSAENATSHQELHFNQWLGYFGHNYGALAGMWLECRGDFFSQMVLKNTTRAGRERRLAHLRLELLFTGLLTHSTLFCLTEIYVWPNVEHNTQRLP